MRRGHSPAAGRTFTTGCANAYVSALSSLRPEDFANADDRREFEEIIEAMTREPAARDEGKVASTLVITSDDAAVELAERIVALDARYP